MVPSSHVDREPSTSHGPGPNMQPRFYQGVVPLLPSQSPGPHHQGYSGKPRIRGTPRSPRQQSRQLWDGDLRIQAAGDCFSVGCELRACRAVDPQMENRSRAKHGAWLGERKDTCRTSPEPSVSAVCGVQSSQRLQRGQRGESSESRGSGSEEPRTPLRHCSDLCFLPSSPGQ